MVDLLPVAYRYCARSSVMVFQGDETTFELLGMRLERKSSFLLANFLFEVNYLRARTIILCSVLIPNTQSPALRPSGKTLAQRSGGAWFGSRPSQTKDFKISISS
ncbi:hypothetical protein ElyMa_000449500 [Elysia marginata]|uniref:Uncharacterized protein n=1 Tax=Elysia marginata TaxID=1093978 RepID=A0AAV4FQC7_9GAST|nr:hypothetical protein ElyMa_000449500 [Elysia marginata]